MESGAHELPGDLLRDDAWPRPQRGVELVETHLSWVLRGDRDVFKVKKPVALGFVDFGSVARRKAACEDEVRLNSRMAPGIYAGVVPVVRREGRGLALGGPGEVVDWAVHMVRLDDARRADALVARDALPDGTLEAVAQTVAEMHARAPVTAQKASALASADAVARNVRDNFEQLRAAAKTSRWLDRRIVSEVEERQTGFVRERAHLFAARIADGRIRDGHGDLRLEHVYVEDAGLRIIDCIEFDERYRIGDVCADVAFLAMELSARDRADLAECFLARYAREAQDYDLYGLVDLYEGYRAVVRAKVSAMLAGQPEAADGARRTAAEQAELHLRVAQASGRPSPVRPAMICVGGIIASGKSTLASGLGRALSCPIVDADRTRKHVLGEAEGTSMHEGPWQGAYDPAVTERNYEEVLRRASVVLASGRTVIVDASFRSARWRVRARELAHAEDASFAFVECRAPLEVSRERLARRAHGPSDAHPGVFDAFASSFEPASEVARAEHVVVDTTAPLECGIALVRERAAPPHAFGRSR
jgi:aminoglycoside phosphotransferase family enzyme/predicted kinase